MAESLSNRLEQQAPGRFPLADLGVSTIDPPVERLRFGYNEEKLAELMASIPQRGLLQPPGVRKVRKRYVTVWGDHRIEAVRRLGWNTVPVFVVKASDDEAVILAAHENLRRHDMSPIEEAGLCQRLYEVLGEDTDRVARELCATRDWVEQRMLMLRWPSDILKLIHEGRLNMKQGRELARIKVDADREHYTGYAVDGGATAASLSGWARDWEMSGVVRDPSGSNVAPGGVAAAPDEAVMPCYFHGDREPMGRLVHVWLCPEALRLFIEFRDAFQAADRAPLASAVGGPGGSS